MKYFQYFMKCLIFHEACTNHFYDIMTFHYYHNKLLFFLFVFYFITGSFRAEGQHGAAEKRLHYAREEVLCNSSL